MNFLILILCTLSLASAFVVPTAELTKRSPTPASSILHPYGPLNKIKKNLDEVAAHKARIDLNEVTRMKAHLQKKPKAMAIRAWNEDIARDEQDIARKAAARKQKVATAIFNKKAKGPQGADFKKAAA
jgi:hypothetical protein